MHGIGINVSEQAIEDFCKKWKIREFSLFGSVLRDDFRHDSDIDVLVDFDPGHGWTLYDVSDMQDQLETLFGRKVDLVMLGGLRNPIRRRNILDTRKVLYAA